MRMRDTLLGAALAMGSLLVAAPALAQTNTSASGSIEVMEPALIVDKTSDLSFGTVTRPTSGSGTISIDANTGNVTTSNMSQVGGSTPSRAAFTVTGEPNRNIQVTYPGSVNLNRAAGGSLQVTITSTMGGGQIGGGGTVTFYLGGQVVLQSTTLSGSYTATFAVTVAYV